MRAILLFYVAIAAVFVASHAQVTRITGRSLDNIDYSNMIAGPINAAVDAQAKAALTTTTYIQKIGLDANGHARTVDFSYTTTNQTTGSKVQRTLRVPLLTIVPIPYIRVTELTLNFNTKLTSMVTEDREQSTTTETPYDRWSFYWWSADRARGSVSTRSKETSSSEVAREYTMSVTVKAVQDEAPAGLLKVLSIMEDAIMRSE